MPPADRGPRRGGGGRWVRRGLGLLLLLLILWPLGDLAYVRLGAEDDQAVRADVILVLGCSIYGGPPGQPSPCIRARADHAAALYRQGLAAQVITSGGAVEEERSEASALAERLQADGVPAAAIQQEDQSRDTIQNIHNSRVILRAHGWQTVILVTEPYHIKRATLIAQDAGLTVYPSPAQDSLSWQDADLRRVKLGKDMLSLMLYQVKRVLGIDT